MPIKTKEMDMFDYVPEIPVWLEPDPLDESRKRIQLYKEHIKTSAMAKVGLINNKIEQIKSKSRKRTIPAASPRAKTSPY